MKTPKVSVSSQHLAAIAHSAILRRFEIVLKLVFSKVILPILFCSHLLSIATTILMNTSGSKREPCDSSCSHAFFFLKNAKSSPLLNLLHGSGLPCLVIHHTFFLPSNLCYGWLPIHDLGARFSETCYWKFMELNRVRFTMKPTTHSILTFTNTPS